MKNRGVWTGAELKAIHDELDAEGVPLAEITLLAKCSTSTLYKIYRNEHSVKAKHLNGAIDALLTLRERVRASA